MRMTNKIMQNNSLHNINNNKILQDKLSTQMSTNKKLTRPSDDPVVAIRALRLRTSVSELTQFKDKNAKDADAWLTVTGDAIATANSILGDKSGMIALMNSAANMEKGPSDLSIIMEQVKSLRDELYATANADYAGRYIFTGYRTDTPLSFTSEVEDKNLTYDITERVKLENFDSINYTDMGNVAGLSKANYTDSTKTAINEVTDIYNGNIHRLRLAYDEVSAGKAPVFSYVSNPNSNPPTVTDLVGGAAALTIDTVSSEAIPDNPYQQIQAANKSNPAAVKVIYVPETGEVLFSDAAYTQFNTLVTDQTDIRVNYEKKEWKEGDLRPEHYFFCQSTEVIQGQPNKVVNYNATYLSDNPDRQKIEYDVGYNQKIAINTTASEIFQHKMDRYVDDLDRVITELTAIDKTVKDMEDVLNGLDEGTAEYTMVEKQLDAARKAYSHIRDNVHGMFEKSITAMQKAQDDINVAVTDNGTRSARLDLISNRLLSQKTTFETLKSDNEDADIAETVVKLTSTELSYNASLMATGKIMQTSLMNYI